MSTLKHLYYCVIAKYQFQRIDGSWVIRTHMHAQTYDGYYYIEIHCSVSFSNFDVRLKRKVAIRSFSRGRCISFACCLRLCVYSFVFNVTTKIYGKCEVKIILQELIRHSFESTLQHLAIMGRPFLTGWRLVYIYYWHKARLIHVR